MRIYDIWVYTIYIYVSIILRLNLIPLHSELFTKPFCNVLVSAVVISLLYSAFFPGSGVLDVVITDGIDNGGDNAKIGFISQGNSNNFSFNFVNTRENYFLTKILFSIELGIIFMQYSCASGLTYLSSISIALITPPMMTVIGIRSTLALASILYSGMFIGIIFLKPWTIYLGSLVTGIL